MEEALHKKCDLHKKSGVCTKSLCYKGGMANSLSKLREILKPNTTPKLLAWLFTIKPILQYVFDVINTVSNVDFAISARGNPRVLSVWNFLISPLGNLCFSAVGFCWLTWFAWRQSKRLQSDEPRANQREQGAGGLIAENLKTVEELQARIKELERESKEENRKYKSELNQKEDISRHLSSIEAELGTYKTTYQQLGEIADNQKRSIDEWVDVETSIEQHDLLGESPYINFRLRVSRFC